MGELNMINEPLSPSIYESWNDVYLNNNVWELPWVNKEIHPELKKLIDSLPIKSGNALDVGCGLGQVSRYLAKVGFDVTAIDISEEAIRLSSELNDTGKHINYRVANSIHYRSEKKFDLIVDFLHLHDIETNLIARYITNLKGLCAPECKIVVAFISDHDQSCPLGFVRNSHFFNGYVTYYSKDYIFKIFDIMPVKFRGITVGRERYSYLANILIIDYENF
jgi:2-polyprenyl-3-methyl-5-hydroxy-6-metoxy-1,4-benzoquinol methylase